MLTAEQMERYRQDGFLRVPDALRPGAAAEVAALLDPLFDRFSALPEGVRRDLGGSGPADTAVRSAEINRPTTLVPALRRTEVYRRCRTIARQLGGWSAGYTFDHAIYKAPFNQRATPWHQDHAYNGHRRLLRTVHFWVPLQDATVENGCMQFVAGSHLHGLQPHRTGAGGHVRETSLPDDAASVACPLPVGGLTLHSPLTLHYTGPNNSHEVRRAWILHFGPGGRLAKLHPAIVADKLLRRA